MPLLRVHAPACLPRSVDSIPGWIAWLHYLSLFFYGELP